MNLCSDSHDEVRFEGRTCPLCSMRDDLNDEITTLQGRVDELEKELEDKE